MSNLYFNTVYILQYVRYIIFFVVSLFLILVILQNYRSNEFTFENNNSFNSSFGEKKCHIDFNENFVFGKYSSQEIKDKAKYIYFGECKNNIARLDGQLIVYVETNEGYDYHSFQVNLNEEGKVLDVYDFCYFNIFQALAILLLLFFVFICIKNNSEK